MSVRVFLLPFALYPELQGVAIETGNDMTDIHGLIPHQTGYYYITLEEDYVLMFQLSADRWFERSAKTEGDKKAHAARRAHAVAKAYISSVLEQLSDKQFKYGISESKVWVFLSFPEIERRIHGGVKLRTLKDAMKEMIDDGYAAKRPNPNRQFRSKIYHMNFKRYRNELNALPKRTEIDDSANLHDGLADSAYDADMHDDSANLHADNADMHDDSANTHDGSGKFAPKNNYRITIEETQNNEEGTFVASGDATPALSQENVFDDDDDPEKTVERLPAVRIETASHIATHDYTNEGGEHARHDYCSEQRPGVSVFLPALGGSDVPPDMHDTPDADQGHPGLSAGLHAASSRDRTDAQTPGDQAVTPFQQTSPDVLAGAASDDGQALDAAATAPPSRTPLASGGKGTGNGKALLCEPAKVRAALLAFRGYALESAGALINENKAIKAWCALHSEGELALVIGALEQDRYWGKAENREHFTISNFVAETPKMLARLKRKGEPRVLDDGATSEWDFANYIGNGPEDMAAWMRRAEEQEAQGLLNF